MPQPYLHAQSIVLQAPVQCWSLADGQVELPPDDLATAHGVFCGDDRVIAALRVSVSGRALEHIATTEPGGTAARYDLVIRTPELGTDAALTLERSRRVTGTSLVEGYVVRSASPRPEHVDLVVEVVPDATPMASVKSGLPRVPVPTTTPRPDGATWSWRDRDTHATLTAPGARVEATAELYRFTWSLDVPARGHVRCELRIDLEDAGAPFVAAAGGLLQRPELPASEHRLRCLVDKAFRDLESLRLAERDRPEAAFLAAGAPWYFTLFGRDSLIAARLLLPTNVALAASTLEVLAGRQGTRLNPDTAEQPGRILHEVRRVELQLHDTQKVVLAEDSRAPDGAENLFLPSEYYGTIDATPLWILLLSDAVAAGMDLDRARALVPALRAALGWLRDHADADGDGFLEYFDESGHGLANQGWKDSADSIRWADGSLTKGPIALVEVQGYAYAALRAGARLLERLAPEAVSDEWDRRAEQLRQRFGQSFWVSDAVGPFPALALDADKRPVDGLSSNIGHLLGTGILDADESRLVVGRLMSPDMASGYGIRTLSTTNGGYWPLGYHVGSVWVHDTAMIIDGMLRSGFTEEAHHLAVQLLRAIEGFGFRAPELFSGTDAEQVDPPMPYPAACRPQAWAAASTVILVRALCPEACPEACPQVG